MSKGPVTKGKIKVVILAGSRDFRRNSLASRLPTALWPVVGKPVLERLLFHLADQGIKQAVVCSTGEGSLLAESICADDRLELRFLDEPLPVGTAGCIRNAASDGTDALLLVFPASVVCPPEVDVLVSAHRDGQSDLTVMLNPYRRNSTKTGQASGIYVCNPGLLEHIPKAGYFDIKEGLIPEMLRAGRTVHAASSPNHAGNFRDRQGYLYAVANYLENAPKLNGNLKLRKSANSQNVWVAVNARVDPEARIYGPVVIMDGATVSSNAVILGPTILGKNAAIGKDSTVINSVLWDSAQVGSNCRIQRCVVDYHTAVGGNAVVEEESISFKPKGRSWLTARHIGLSPLLILERPISDALEAVRNNAGRLQRALQPRLRRIDEELPDWAQSSKKSNFTLLGAGLVLLAFFWSYWHGLVDLWNLWQRDNWTNEYSCGFLVPFLAIYILRSRRREVARCPVRPSIWGLFAFMAAQAVRLFGLFFMYSSAERLSVVLSIAALVLLLFGGQVFRKVSAILLFLCLMLPWPNLIQYYVGLNLQRWATSSAVFCLEVIGYEVIQEGNIIHVGDASVAVAEACNGLRMITAFFVITGFVVLLLVKRKWWEKLIVLVSSLPIALLCNTVRLAITAAFFTVLKGEHWEKIFHDFGGYAMMPLALAAVVGELWLLAKLTALPRKEEAVIIARQSS